MKKYLVLNLALSITIGLVTFSNTALADTTISQTNRSSETSIQHIFVQQLGNLTAQGLKSIKNITINVRATGISDPGVGISFSGWTDSSYTTQALWQSGPNTGNTINISFSQTASCPPYPNALQLPITSTATDYVFDFTNPNVNVLCQTSGSPTKVNTIKGWEFPADVFYLMTYSFSCTTPGCHDSGIAYHISGSMVDFFANGNCIDENISFSAKCSELDDTYFIIHGFGPFLSQIQNTPIGAWNFREQPTNASTVIRTLPEGWVVKVLSTTDANGNNIEADGYRWYQVEDPTDRKPGYMQGVNLADGTIYLDYNPNAQSDLAAKSDPSLNNTRALRTPKIEQAVDNYISASSSNISLEGGGGGNGQNNFPGFISDGITPDGQFPRELFLGLISDETGSTQHDLNNEICNDGHDGGIGVMQLTRSVRLDSQGIIHITEPKGAGSGLIVPSKNLDCGNGYNGSTSTYYSNSIQGIYANVKDGVRVLQDKFSRTVTNNACDSNFLAQIGLSCSEYRRGITVWRYRGYTLQNNYDKWIADLISTPSSPQNLNIYFPNTINNTNQSKAADIANKLIIINNNKLEIMLHSPGDLSVVDASGNRTGLYNGTLTENVNGSAYDEDHKLAAIFFPSRSSNAYSYIVQGTDTGVYGLTIDNNNNSDTPTSVNYENVHLSPNEVYKYTVDWPTIQSGGKGVHVDVDKNGDGTYDYSFTGPATVNDTVAPVSSASLSGTAGKNGWYISDVSVSLSAADNTGGVGVLETDYSLDNGTTWNKYASPFTLSTEGINTVLYRSEDFVGNVESTNTQTIKIDKTNPEVRIYFDVPAQQVKVIGTDNLTTPTVTQPSADIYLIEDESGRNLTVNLTGSTSFSPVAGIYQFLGHINSLKYNNGWEIAPPANQISYSWQNAVNPVLLQQNIRVGGQFNVSATYNEATNTTQVFTIDANGTSNNIQNGLAILVTKTLNGVLSFATQGD